MNQHLSKHLEYGELIALAQSEILLEKNSIKKQHIEECPRCGDLLDYLTVYSNSVLKSKNGNIGEAISIGNCPYSDSDFISIFFSFFTGSLPQKKTAQLLRHFNNCYPCFEAFMINWNAFLSIERLSEH